MKSLSSLQVQINVRGKMQLYHAIIPWFFSGKILVISHHGASGVYPGSTDLAYQQSVDDGADIIDCSVQMSKDGVPFCFNSADLLAGSNAMTSFMSRSTMISEIQPTSGIFSFDLTWTEIQTLTRKFLTTF